MTLYYLLMAVRPISCLLVRRESILQIPSSSSPMTNTWPSVTTGRPGTTTTSLFHEITSKVSACSIPATFPWSGEWRRSRDRSVGINAEYAMFSPGKIWNAWCILLFKLLTDRGAGQENTLLGFHWPFYTVGHLHLHAISPTNQESPYGVVVLLRP